MTPKTITRITRVMKNPHLWVLVIIYAAITIIHYSPLWNSVFPEFSFGLTRHALDRILLLIPILYSALVFGLEAGIINLVVSLAIMLPRALFISATPKDALLEITGIIIVGILINAWMENERREKGRHQKTIESLEEAQHNLGVSERRLAALNSISQFISQFKELQQVLNSALAKVVQVLDLETAVMFLIDDETDTLDVRAYHGVSEELVAGVNGIKIGEGLNGWVAESGEPLLVKNISKDPRLTRKVVEKERLQAQLIVPIKSKSKTIGTLSIGARHAREFYSDEVDLVTAIGNEIGIVIDNARLYEEQSVMAEQLRLSEKNYRELFEKAHDAIWVHDMDGNIIQANDASARLSGYKLQELLQMNVKSFLNETSLNLAKKVRQKLITGQSMKQPYEQQLLRKDGTEASLMLTTSLINRNGFTSAFQHIARDVTSEKKKDANLHFYLQQITKAQEEERKRIARELHDDTAQALVVLSRQLDSMISSPDPSVGDTSSLENLREQIDEILDGVRRFSQDLRPSVLDDLGLLAALEWLASDVTDHFGISFGMEVIGSERRFSQEQELLMFRITQEALTNVWRHSEATRALIMLEYDEDKTILSIRDNGKGFNVPERLSDLPGDAKLGLAGMEERIGLLDGKLKIQSAPGRGTTITIEVPI